MEVAVPLNVWDITPPFFHLTCENELNVCTRIYIQEGVVIHRKHLYREVATCSSKISIIRTDRALLMIWHTYSVPSSRSVRLSLAPNMDCIGDPTTRFEKLSTSRLQISSASLIFPDSSRCRKTVLFKFPESNCFLTYFFETNVWEGHIVFDLSSMCANSLTYSYFESLHWHLRMKTLCWKWMCRGEKSRNKWKCERYERVGWLPERVEVHLSNLYAAS